MSSCNQYFLAAWWGDLEIACEMWILYVTLHPAWNSQADRWSWPKNNLKHTAPPFWPRATWTRRTRTKWPGDLFVPTAWQASRWNYKRHHFKLFPTPTIQNGKRLKNTRIDLQKKDSTIMASDTTQARKTWFEHFPFRCRKKELDYLKTMKL